MSQIEQYNPKIMVERLQAQIQIVNEVRTNILVKDVDYGVIPGTPKPTLYQPGAQKLIGALRLSPIYKLLTREIDRETGWIFYEFLCELYDETGFMVAQAIGNCNSYEQKYRRWVTATELPAGFNPTGVQTRESSLEEFDFAIKKREVGGKWGKPVEYWNAWDEAIANGTAQVFQKKKKDGNSDKAWRIHTLEYNLPNPNIYDQLNTICKMAQKRAFVGATVMGARASDYFTQDIEDMPQFGDVYNRMSSGASDDVIDAAFEEIHDPTPRPAKTESPQRPMPKAETPAPQQPTPTAEKPQDAKQGEKVEGEPFARGEHVDVGFKKIRRFIYRGDQPAAELIAATSGKGFATVWSTNGVQKHLIDTGWLEAEALDSWKKDTLELSTDPITVTVEYEGFDHESGTQKFKVVSVQPHPELIKPPSTDYQEIAGELGAQLEEQPAPKSKNGNATTGSNPLGKAPNQNPDEIPF